MTIDYKQEFFDFLREHNAYKEYIKEFEKANPNITFDLYFLPDEYDQYINGAFEWVDSGFGHEYWSDLYDKWVTHLYSNRVEMD